MKFLSNCFKGIAIGSGAILPGISSGVFCVIFGKNEKILYTILKLFSELRKKFKFLFPIMVGIGLGIILFGNILNYCLYQFPIQTKSIFIGLILGSIPTLIKEVNGKEKWKPFNLIFFFVALLLGIGCIFLESSLQVQTLENINFLYLVLGGFVMSIGIVVPGVSSTIILMLLGIYSVYLNAISSLYFPILLPIGIGVISGGLCFMKLTKYLLEHFYAPTFYSIIGFTVGSIFVLLPSFSSNIDIILGVLSCLLRLLY